MEILYQDDRICLLNKPPDLLVHRSHMGRDTDTVVDRLKTLFEKAPSPVHRLDRATSGVLLCTFDAEAARFFGEAFSRGEVEKTYWAVVRGWPAEEGKIDAPLDRPDGEAQEALTLWRRLETTELPVPNETFPTSRYSWIEARPQTGRYHQIRRHLARRGYPILGDTSHGDLRHNRRMKEYCGGGGLCLHARTLRFPHPDGTTLEIQAPLPEEKRNLWNCLGFPL